MVNTVPSSARHAPNLNAVSWPFAPAPHLAHIPPSKPPAPRKPDEAGSARYHDPKALLKADKEGGRIVLDDVTILGGIPPEAWAYKLGNRSALEWILDQYKERKPKDPTIREKFDTYRFADYKDNVIDLLPRVTTVSVRTVAITRAMKTAAR
jgi:predicted helicase